MSFPTPSKELPSLYFMILSGHLPHPRVAVKFVRGLAWFRLGTDATNFGPVPSTSKKCQIFTSSLGTGSRALGIAASRKLQDRVMALKVVLQDRTYISRSAMYILPKGVG